MVKRILVGKVERMNGRAKPQENNSKYYPLPSIAMSQAVATAHSFNKILNQTKVASKSRSSGEIDDGTKKLRRMILVEGIPSSVVSRQFR